MTQLLSASEPATSDLAIELDRYHRSGSAEAAVAAHLVDLLVRRRREPAMPDAEVDVWTSVGASAGLDAAAEAATLVTTATEMAALESRSFDSPAAIAEALGVTASRVSQMTSRAQLLAFKDRTGVMRYPRWQVVGGRALPGLSHVLDAVRPGVHPLVIDRWFTTPNADLDLGGMNVAPAGWLATGGPAAALAASAAAL